METVVTVIGTFPQLNSRHTFSRNFIWDFPTLSIAYTFHLLPLLTILSLLPLSFCPSLVCPSVLLGSLPPSTPDSQLPALSPPELASCHSYSDQLTSCC